MPYSDSEDSEDDLKPAARPSTLIRHLPIAIQEYFTRTAPYFELDDRITMPKQFVSQLYLTPLSTAISNYKFAIASTLLDYHDIKVRKKAYSASALHETLGTIELCEERGIVFDRAVANTVVRKIVELMQAQKIPLDEDSDARIFDYVVKVPVLEKAKKLRDPNAYHLIVEVLEKQKAEAVQKLKNKTTQEEQLALSRDKLDAMHRQIRGWEMDCDDSDEESEKSWMPTYEASLSSSHSASASSSASALNTSSLPASALSF